MIISVLVEININKKEKTFDYNVPLSMQKFIKKGIRVTVPFGKQVLEGFVTDIKNKSDYELKDIINIVDKESILNDELLSLGKIISNENVCNLISVYQSMLPKAFKASQKTNINVKKNAYISLINEKIAKEFIINSKAKKQVEVVNNLIKNKEELKNKYSNSIIKSLIEKKIIKVTYKEYYRLDNSCEIEAFKTLNDEQKRCVDEIKNSKKDVILLNGVTGSGKTEIYINLINEQIKKGKEVIMLVPEISLTPQIITRFKRNFGDKIAILHSGLSNGEKYDEYRKILRKKVSIVIGARSAIFAPFTNIGLIVIDEEHSSTYKQDHNPRYNAIDVAIIRGKNHNAKVILGSATPKIETYARSKKGYYELVKLNKRANNASMPFVTIVDMQKEIKKGNSIFSNDLLLAIEDRLNKKEQIILFINKRGYSSYLMCKCCGEVFKCPNCDITLTYHKTSDMNRCHYCGYADKRKDICPNCGSDEIKSYGLGTEKVEEEIKSIFNGVRTIRMDIDTTTKKGSHEKIINSFSNHEADILIGTQMVSKGLDFPLVTLVGVINADTTLNLPDFRANEKTYQLISQVSGRAGRSKTPGKVIIQTYNPDNYSIVNAKNHDYESFYNEEIKIRKKLSYPPYFFISLIKVGGKDFKETINESNKISNYLKSKKKDYMIILGPSVGSVSKVNNIYYFEIMIKYRDKEYMKKLLNSVYYLEENNNKIKVDIDVNM